MIERFSDHAANERTFLAWVRTAISIIAFGFLVEKFDLFLTMAGQARVSHPAEAENHTFGTAAGLLLIALGAATMVLAIIRFRKTARDIDSPDVRIGTGARIDIALAGLLALLGVSLFVYLLYTVVDRL